MKTDLFFAVIGEDAAAFRAATQRQVVTLARRRRRRRVIRRVTGGVALLAASALLLGTWFAPLPEGTIAAPEPGFAMVESQPIAPGMILRTNEAAFVPVASGLDFGGMAMIHSRPVDIAITETRLAGPAFDYWNDRQLLAAFPGQRAALVEPGTERARLIFY